jgi:multidrug efflux pump subunit AcrB
VAVPIISSTLTTLAAFFPMLFWPGITGEFMKFLPQTLIITLSSSLFVALVAVPTLCAMYMRLDGAPKRPMRPAARWTMLALGALVLLAVGASNPLAALLLAATAVGLVALHRAVLARVARWFQDHALPATIGVYQRQLAWALRHRRIVLATTAASFVITVVVFGALNAGVEFFPESIPPATVYARVDVPSGTSPEFANDVTERVEARLAGIQGMGDAESVVATVGGTGGGLFASSAEGNVAVNFIDFDKRSHDVFETLRLMQQEMETGAAGADLTVEKPANGPPAGKPINIEIVGQDVEQLKQLSDRALAVLKANPVYARMEGLDSDMARGRPELVVEVDREKAALYDLSTIEVGSTVRTAIQGTEAAKFRAGKDEYDIVVRLAEPFRGDLESLRDLTVVADGQQIPLPSVASWRVDEGLGTVRRKDLDRVATISSDVRAGEQSNAVLADVRVALEDFAASLPPGYSLRYTGQQEEQMEAQQFLGGAFMIALALIALILMSQFNSVLKPLIIMTSVIMSTVGVLIGLMVFRMPFGIIMTGVGVISLAGVVVNNAIVLLDYIDLLRTRDGLSRTDALLRAGATRFRPVVLTAITTVLGLVPLAIGFNFDFFGLYTALAPNIFWGGEQAAWWGPMAIAVIAGLSFATVLTLVIVPVLYATFDDLGLAFRRNFSAAEAPTGEVIEESAEPAQRPRRRRRPLAGALARFQRPGSGPAAGAAGAS